MQKNMKIDEPTKGRKNVRERERLTGRRNHRQWADAGKTIVFIITQASLNRTVRTIGRRNLFYHFLDAQ